jgi:tetratricopeptide (TPR) repeat protein
LNRAERRRLAKAEGKSTSRAPGDATRIAQKSFDLGNTLASQGLTVEAERAYRDALRHNPDFPEALSNLASLYHREGRLSEAEQTYRAALHLLPDNPVILENIAIVLQNSGKTPEAIAAFRTVLNIDPGRLENHFSLAGLLAMSGETEAAISSWREVLKLDPRNVPALTNLANLYAEQYDFDDAIETHKRALEISPDEVTVMLNLGLAYRWADRPCEAIEIFERLLDLQPERVDVLSLLGSAHMDTGNADAALEIYNRILVLKPDDPETLSFRARPLLIKQEFEAGYRAQESADQQSRLAHPEWRGEDLVGKSIVVWGDEGVGDEVLFASCLPDLQVRAGTVTLVSDARLVPLFARSFPAINVVSKSGLKSGPEPGEFDYQIRFGGLPRHLRPDLNSFPDHDGYLIADAARQSHWRGVLDATGPGRKIGICWRSSRVTLEGFRDYAPIVDWTPILSLPGVTFISLLYDDAVDDLKAIDQNLVERVHILDGIDLFNDLDESAALVSQLDLVIAPLSTTAWITASQGVQTRVLNRPGDWRQFGTDHYPWFPAARFTTKPVGSTWRDTMLALAQELDAQLSS